MTPRRRPTALALVLALALAGGSGCMFRVRHELPPNAYFGRLPASADERVTTFEDHAMKNWALAGLVPYTSFSTDDLLPHDRGTTRVENLAVKTEFSTIDTIVWVIPGFAYGYYLWAPRTITVRGARVTTADAAATR
jgi:hypothetical protein